MRGVFLPALLYFGAGALIIVVLTRRVSDAERKSLIALLLVGLAVRIGAVIAFELIPPIRFFHEDATGNQWGAILLAKYWSGEWPFYEIPRHNIGYLYWNATQCYVLGYNAIFAPLANCIFGTLAALYVFRIARMFFNVDVAKLAARLTLFFPSMIIWSSVAMKDSLMHMLVLCIVYHVILVYRKFSVLNAVVVSLALVAVYYVRFYMLYIILFSMVASYALLGRRLLLQRVGRQLAVLVLFALTIIALGMDREARSGIDRVSFKGAEQLRIGLATTARSGFKKETRVRSRAEALALMPVGVLFLLFSPFPWQYTSLRSALTLPEMLVWWALTPFWVMGFWYVIRYRVRDLAVVVIYSVVVLLAYSVFHGNLGVMYRQRTQVFVFFFIFLAFGMYRWKYKRMGMDQSRLFADADAPAAP